MEEKRSHKNLFTEEEIELLSQNPNVKSITESTVIFTEEFRESFYEQAKAGKSSSQIFMEAGIDPRLLGESRVQNYRYTTMKRHRLGAGASTQRRTDGQMSDISARKRIQELEHELAYVRQEVEFLKKLQAANMEAQKSWESKHQRK